MKKFLFLLLVFVVSFCTLGAFAASEVSEDDYTTVEKSSVTMDDNSVKELLKTVKDVDYYAFLNLDSAEDSLKPVILEARRMYIERVAGAIGGLAADGVYGEEIAPDGTVVCVIPQFHELFPEDWDYPG